MGLANWTAGVLLMSGALAGAEAPQDVYEETIDQTFPLAEGGSFTLENKNGSVELATWDKNEVRVVAQKRMDLDSGGWWIARLIGFKSSNIETEAQARELFSQLSVEFSGDEQSRTVHTHYPDVRDVNCQVAYQITAPKKSRVDLDTVNGAVKVRGVEGEVAAASTSGAVTVEGARGPVNATSTNGRLSVETSGGTVHAKTTNGSVAVTVTGILQDVELRSVNGSVRLAVPANSAFNLKARTVNGSVHCDLPVTGAGEQSRKHIEGVVGAGGPEVALSTTNGSVTVEAAGQ